MQFIKPSFKTSGWVLTFLFSFSITQHAFSQTATPPSGSGTSGDPYLISSLNNLYWLSQNDSEWASYYKLTTDIDASSTSTWDSGFGFSPIGNSTTAFTGNFNGDGYEISDLTINRSGQDNIGLFGYINGATLSNIGLISVSIVGNDYVGGLVGYSGTAADYISYSYTTGTVEGANSVGGLAGWLVHTSNDGDFNNLYSIADVVASGSNGGGLIGYLYGSISSSWAAGDVTVSGNYAGGLVGYANSPSANKFIISKSYATGDVQGVGGVGGVLGRSLRTALENTYSTGSVSGTSDVGGLIGLQSGGVTNITNNYSTGLVSGSSNVGGFMGRELNARITGGYWNTETSGQSIDVGNGDEVATGLTSSEMTVRANFSAFDFGATWNNIDGLTQPQLRVFLADSIDGYSIADYQTPPSGSGTVIDPYQIDDLPSLYWLSENESAWADYFVQTADIDASEVVAWYDSAGFSPIGNATSSFTGSYDGGDYTISGLTIDRSGEDNIGLFGIGDAATLSNITLLEANVIGNENTGTLAGQISGASTVTGSYATGEVTSVGDSLGGLIGSLSGSGSYEYSDLGSDVNVSSTGSLSFIGGLIGTSHADLSESYATGNVTTDGLAVGGLVGFLSGSVTNSYTTGDIIGDQKAGGVVGNSSGTIEDSYATGDISGDTQVGGVLGYNTGTVTAGYSTGVVIGTSDTGGFLGENNGGTITGGYWDTETSGLSTGIGTDDNTQTVTGLTSSQMLTRSNFIDFDFDTTWNMISGLTQPQLRAFLVDSIDGYFIADFETLPNGSGTSGDPYQIANLGDIYWLSESDTAWADYFIQTADIDASKTIDWYNSAGFSPIGNSTTAFTGNFNGDGYEISDLTINRGTEDNIGLFGYINGATLSNIGLTSVSILGNDHVGGLVGYSGTTADYISYSYTTGTVEGANSVGGLAGWLYHPFNDGDFNNLYSTADVTVSGSNGGGLIGYLNGSLSSSWATGDVTVSSLSAGGLVGYAYSLDTKKFTISESYATGDVQSQSAQQVGGLLGRSLRVALENTYSTGSVSGTSDVGGLLGLQSGGSTDITNNYSTGLVSGSSNVGGFIGRTVNGQISGAYWNTETSGLSIGIGSGSGTITGLDSVEMTVRDNFSGFDFDATWNSINSFSRPYLQAIASDSIDGLAISDYHNAPAGNGTAIDPYQIDDLLSLYWISESDSAWARYYTQIADIDASEVIAWYDSAGFSPIGNSTTAFSGNYDGGGYSISGLTINRPEEDNIGLFGIGNSSTLTNINVLAADITADYNAGILAAEIRGGSTLKENYASGVLTADSGSVGGLVGSLEGSSSYEFSDLVAAVDVTMTTISTSGSVGGLIGNLSGDLSDSYATGSISSSGAIAGGLLGSMGSGTLESSYSAVDVSGVDYTGGLIGVVSGATVENSYATGVVSGDGQVGGLVAEMQSGAIIASSYSIGLVTGTMDVGAFVGINSGTITDGYWNTETSGQVVGIGTDNNAQIVTGLTSSQMRDSSNFTGYEFDTTWTIKQGGTFPYLQSIIPETLPGADSPVSETPSGSGTQANPYQIASLDHLYWISQTDSVWGEYFIQTADIDAFATVGWNGGEGFSPIGNTSTYFSGSYNGDGFTLSDLTIERPGSAHIGLFGLVDSARLDGISLADASITGKYYVGGLVGFLQNGGSVTNSNISGKVTGTGDGIGGMVGTMQSSLDTVSFSRNYSSVAVSSPGDSVGGLIGEVVINVDGSAFSENYATGDISGKNFVGGLIGYIGTGSTTIIDSYATGDINGEQYVGGLIGEATGIDVTRIFAIGEVIGTSSIGGVLGEITSGATTSDLYWNTETSGLATGIGFADGSQTATGLTIAEMIDSTSFVGFDFANTEWGIDQGFTYPYLKETNYRISVATIDGDEGWRMIGHPGIDATYGELLEPLWTQGFTGADSETGANNVSVYNESIGGYEDIASADDLFGVNSSGENSTMNGVYVYVYASSENDGVEEWPKYLVSEYTNKDENYDIELTIADSTAEYAGWHLVSNPYHTALDWKSMVDAGDIDPTNTLAIAYVYNDMLYSGAGGYKMISGYQLPPGVDESFITNDPIPAMQSFFTAATASGSTLSFKPEHQAEKGEYLIKEIKEDTLKAQPVLTLSFVHEKFTDKAAVFAGWDKESPKFNIPKLSVSNLHTQYSEMALSHGKKRWASRSLEEVKEGMHYRIPLELTTTEMGSFTLSWKGLELFADDWELTLIDELTGHQVSLNEEEEFTFDITRTEELTLKNGNARFVLNITVGSLVVGNELGADIPFEYSLSQNYPNPFNPTTNIQFGLPESGNVELIVFDILGRRVSTLVNGRMEAGKHTVRFNARDLASGVYLYQLRAGNNVFNKRFTLIK